MKIPIERTLIVPRRNYIQAVTFSVLRRRSWRVHNVLVLFSGITGLQKKYVLHQNINLHSPRAPFAPRAPFEDIPHRLGEVFTHLSGGLTYPQGGS